MKGEFVVPVAKIQGSYVGFRSGPRGTTLLTIAITHETEKAVLDIKEHEGVILQLDVRRRPTRKELRQMNTSPMTDQELYDMQLSLPNGDTFDESQWGLNWDGEYLDDMYVPNSPGPDSNAFKAQDPTEPNAVIDVQEVRQSSLLPPLRQVAPSHREMIEQHMSRLRAPDAKVG